MSAKHFVMHVIEGLPDDVSFAEIVRSLRDAQSTQDALRRFDERGGIPDEDLTDDEWKAMISRSLAEDLNDPRQDIYTEEDGKPVR